jgi:predicted ATP-grasp superfamily ATP-dependent carboligase
MPVTALLTLGRLPKGLDIARALHAAGCRVIVAEPFAWHICRLSRAVARSYQVAAPNRDKARYLDDLAAIVEREAVDVVVPVSEEALHALALRDRVPARVRFYSPPAALVHRLHDKLHFARLAQELGLDVPVTHPLASAAAREYAVRYDYIVKPRHSCSGIGFSAHPRGAPVPEVQADSPAVLQAFVAGEHLSTFSIARNGRVVGTVIYRGTVFSGTVAVCFERVAEQAAISTWVAEFVARTQYDGFVSFDFIVADGRPFAIECNPRLTSGVHYVAPPTLAAAILGDDHVSFEHNDRRLLQQFYPALTETQKTMFGPGPFRRNLGQLLAARDVVWSPRDPWPFLLMTPVSWELLRLTIFGGLSFGEAATADIAWFGAEQADVSS